MVAVRRKRPWWMCAITVIVLFALPGTAHAGASMVNFTPAATANTLIGCIVSQAYGSHGAPNYPNESPSSGLYNGMGVDAWSTPTGCSGGPVGSVDIEAGFFFTTNPAAGPQHQCLYIPYNGATWGHDFVGFVWNGVIDGFTCENPDRGGWYATASNSGHITQYGVHSLVGYGSWWTYHHTPYV